MTFAEVVLFVAIGLLVYFFLRPLQKKLEASFFRFFRSRTTGGRGGHGPTIDVTDTAKTARKAQTNKEDPHGPA